MNTHYGGKSHLHHHQGAGNQYPQFVQCFACFGILLRFCSDMYGEASNVLLGASKKIFMRYAVVVLFSPSFVSLEGFLGSHWAQFL